VTITEERSFELGVGVEEDPEGTPVKQYFHGNLIGTTRHVSDVTGAKTDAVAYTAFGERVTGTNHRYGYAGAWGYQSDDSAAPAFPFLHVGHRYYDPATGRFLQRDLIGIRGGLNVYSYVRNQATIAVDPLGLHEVGMTGLPNPGRPYDPKNGYWSDGDYYGPPPRPKTSVDLEAELRKERRIQAACYAGRKRGHSTFQVPDE
jgi:RHS repeat-associated protein